MSGFKINFKLKSINEISSWGEAPHQNIHWFGLTDGLLWITVGNNTIYEYSKEALNAFNKSNPYNDYYLSRFLEDFSYIFGNISQSIPKELYEDIENIEALADAWKNMYIHKPDDVFDKFYEREFEELMDFKYIRSFDSGHLTGGPYIGFFKHENNIKILWESKSLLENGKNIWTFPQGCYEMLYDEFVLETKSFFNEFFSSMDKQVENAIKKDWGDVFLDKHDLKEENSKRKDTFKDLIKLLNMPEKHSDWNRVTELYKKMKRETK